jgi:DNA-binding FadR family transcriptional regulator
MSTTTRAAPTAKTAVFAQLAGARRVEQVAQRLTDAIVLGVLAPGERLPSEAQLAKRFGVALVTAREGLGVLRDNGLVETRRGRDGGSFVMAPDEPRSTFVIARLSGLTRVELEDMALFFSVITAGAAERAATRTSAPDARRMEAWLAAAEYSTESAARRAEGGFHLELAVLSQSARLVREQIRVQADFGALLWFGLREREDRQRSRAYHRAVIAALAARRPSDARDLVIAHLAHSLDRLLEIKFSANRGNPDGR